MAHPALSAFSSAHNPCTDGEEFLSRCSSPGEAWRTAKPEFLVWAATRPGVLSWEELGRFACFCARQNWEVLGPVGRDAIETAERYWNGQAHVNEVRRAAYAAYAAHATHAAYAAYAAHATHAAYAADAAAGADQAQWLRAHAHPVGVEV